MAQELGRLARIWVAAGAAGTPATKVGKAFDAELSRNPVQATHNSYDSAAGVNRKVVRYDAQLSFKMFTDRADAGQNIIRAAVGSTPAQITVDLLPDGSSDAQTAGQPYERFTANVTIKKGHPIDGMAVTDVTLDIDGVITASTY